MAGLHAGASACFLWTNWTCLSQLSDIASGPLFSHCADEAWPRFPLRLQERSWPPSIRGRASVMSISHYSRLNLLFLRVVRFMIDCLLWEKHMPQLTNCLLQLCWQGMRFLTNDEMIAEAHRCHHFRKAPPLHTWLQHSQETMDSRRLKAIGNVVIPKVASLACQILGRFYTQSFWWFLIFHWSVIYLLL